MSQPKLQTHPKKGTRYYIPSKKEFTPQVEAVIRGSSIKYGLNPELVRAILLAESGGWSKIISKAGAVGPGQWMPDSWTSWSKKHYGTSLPLEDREDPMKAIPVTAHFLSWIQQYLSEPEFRTKKDHKKIGAIPADSWNRGDWGKIWGAYNTGIYGFVGRRRWKDPDYMESMIEKRLVNAQGALRPQTRILLFGDSVTVGYHKANDIRAQMRQRGWDVLITPKSGSDSKFWFKTFKSPETEEQNTLNEQISGFNPTHIIAVSMGGNDSKYLVRSKKHADRVSWDSYKDQYVKPLMGIVTQWGGPPPAGSEFKRFDFNYDELKKQINDEYKEVARENRVDYHDAREATKSAGMIIEPQTWHFTPDQYRDLWAERNRAIDDLIRRRPTVESSMPPGPTPKPVPILEPKKMPKEGEKSEFDELLRQIQQNQKFFQIERKDGSYRLNDK